MANKPNKYGNMLSDQMDEHLSNYLINHWSYSSVEEFTRNEKSFEMKYIYKIKDYARGVSGLVGNIYHDCLEVFFNNLKGSKQELEMEELLTIGWDMIDNLKATAYKLTAKYENTGIEAMKNDVLKDFNTAIQHFYLCKTEYLAPIKEIIGVELEYTNFIDFDYEDYECPLPLKMRLDLLYINQDDELEILDHKLKFSTYTREKDALIEFATQSTAYTKGVNHEMEIEAMKTESESELLAKYPKIAKGVQKVIFAENKLSKNRDGTPQVQFITVDIPKMLPLYEAMLAEKLSRLCEAVSNPDYVYLPNRYDMFTDNAEMLDYWIKTYMGELEEFSEVNEGVKARMAEKKLKRQKVIDNIKKIPAELLAELQKSNNSLIFTDMTNKTPSEKIEFKLKLLSVPAEVTEVIEGYSCNTYLLRPSAGITLKQITSKRMDIAQALGVSSVRMPENLIERGIERGKESFVAIEVNKTRTGNEEPLYLTTSTSTSHEEVPLGRDIFGEVLSWKYASPTTPHILIAGASGSGKSVCLESMIETIKLQGGKITILDPKREFGHYKQQGIVVLEDQEEIEMYMAVQVLEMDEVYKKHGAKYSGQREFILFDESADAFRRQKKQKDLDGQKTLLENTLLIAQKGRSAKMHLVMVAQRFSAKIFDGDTKANFTARLCFTVASAIDSKVMLGVAGAEELNGKGDFLFSSPDYKELVRGQAFMHKPINIKI